MSKPYEISFPLSLIKKYVIFTFKRFYGEYIVVGRENIPTNCPIIFAPNHINALMDALAVHSIAADNLPVTFLARSDIFNNKFAAKILFFIKMLPAFRMRDGVENLGRNNKIFENCVEILHHNKALGIMPEGNQGEQLKLRPFVKGIFRIAFAAQEKYGTQPTVKIIPVGINLGDYTKFGKHIIIIVGKPIEVSDYMTRYAENPATTTNEIRDKLQNDLSNLSLNLASETHYDCFEIATDVANTAVVKKLGLANKSIYRFVARLKIAKQLVAIEINEPEKLEELEILCNEYKTNLVEMNLRTSNLEQTPYRSASLLLNGLLLLGTLPIFIQGLILNFIPFFLPVIIRKYLIKVKYTGFYSSVHYGLGILTFPLFYFLQTILFSCLIDASWWVVLVFLFSQYIVGKLAFLWYCEVKKQFAILRYLNLKNKKSLTLEQTQNLQKKIIQLINM